MNLGNYINIIYSFTDDKYNNVTEFFKDFVNNSVNDENSDFINNTASSTINKYINGKLSFKSCAKKIITNSDKGNLTRFLETIFNDKNKIDFFNQSFHSNNTINSADDISNEFYNIITIIISSPKKEKANKKTSITQNNQSLAASAVNASSNDILEKYRNIENEIKAADIILNNKIPDSIKGDFEYKSIMDSHGFYPRFIPKNKNSLKNHKLTLNYNFDNSNEKDIFIRKIQKAQILKKAIEVDNKNVDLYIDDFKDEYFKSNNYRHFVGPNDNNRPSFNINFSLRNDNMVFKLDNVNLEYEKSVDDSIIYNNINNTNDWFFLELIFDLKNYEKGVSHIHLKLGFRGYAIKNIKYFKEIFKYEILSSENNTKLTIIENNSNTTFMNLTIKDKKSYDDNRIKDFNNYLNEFDIITEIQELSNTVFDFDFEECFNYKASYTIVHNCLRGFKTIINRDTTMDLIIPNSDIEKFKLGKINELINEIDSLYLFNSTINFPPMTLKASDVEILSIENNGDNNIIKISAKKLLIDKNNK